MFLFRAGYWESEKSFLCFVVYPAGMVLSSQTNQVRYSPYLMTDVAARWRNLADAAATGALGCNSLVLSNPQKGVMGDTGTGRMATCGTLSFWKIEGGGWERSNLSPTGGRQHGRKVMSSNELTQGDDLGGASFGGLGAVVVGGASCPDRRIAQASNGNQYGCFGVFDHAYGRVLGVSGQNLRDTVGPSRDVDNVCEGKPRVRNICGAKGLRTDCTANHTWLLIGLHLRETGRKIWLTWEVPCYTSRLLVRGWRQGMGAAESRFKPNELGLPFKCGVLVFGLGRKLPSVKGCAIRHIWVNLRGLRASIAQHLVTKGWPPEWQHFGQGDSCSGCGQTCNSSAVFSAPHPETANKISTHDRRFLSDVVAPSLGNKTHGAFLRFRLRWLVPVTHPLSVRIWWLE